ncbi:MAG: ImmA/IrrE family metallo-endopeptidase [Dehalococcoidia bacterium]|nr:ImmA/IrrE family metallo-endopeptidase [Dehalococcoidia bacterium]
MSAMRDSQFNRARLDLARRRRGMTKRALAGAAGISIRSLAGYFRDEREPEQATAVRFAEILRFPVGFFYGPTLDEVSQEGPSFRALSKMTARQRDQATAGGTLGVYLCDWIERRFRLPEPDIPQYEYADPEIASMELRARWGLGARPIRQVVPLLELHGVRVFSLAEDTLSVDAYSVWREETPYIFLNTQKSAERSRMDAAHELGHLVLHSRGGIQRNRQAEREAQQFGASFLMPRASVGSTVRRGMSLEEIVRAKHHWTVSAAGLTYRLHELGLLTRYEYSQRFIEIGRLNYRTEEPEPAPRERSQVLEKVFGRLKERGVSVSKVADELSIHPDEVGKLLIGLVGFPVALES